MTTTHVPGAALPPPTDRAADRPVDSPGDAVVAPPARTFLPVVDDDRPPAVARAAVGAANADDLFLRWGTAAASVALAWLITQRLLPLDGVPWFLIVLVVCVVAMTALLGAMTGTAVEVKDKVASVVVSTGALVVGVALVSTIAFVLIRGRHALPHPNFFLDDMAGVDPKAGFDRGGVAHAIVGSLIQLGIALLVTLPLGIGTAIFMTEVGGRFARIVRTVVEAMTALPSIVAGLFVYAVLILTLDVPPSGFAAGMAISVMMLPIIARAADVVLRVVPGTLREASLALGASRWRTVWHVVLPTARPGLATAVILGVARGIGETSPVLLTSGAANFMVTDPVGGAMNSLPLYIYNGARSGEPALIDRAFGAAAVLMLLVLVLFVIARLLARPAGARNRPGLLRRVRSLRPAPRPTAAPVAATDTTTARPTTDRSTS